MQEQAQERVKEAAGGVQTQLREQIGQRSTQAGEQVGSTAQALRSTSERLRDEGQDAPARMAEQMADRADRLSSYLRESDPDRILHDLEDFGRRQPLAVVGVGLFVGFAASRFLKASSRTRYEAALPSSTS
jgi:hypothetical protein